jgi:hypothetical protein
VARSSGKEFMIIDMVAMVHRHAPNTNMVAAQDNKIGVVESHNGA